MPAIKSAPALLQSITAKAKAVRKKHTDDGAALPTPTKDIALEVDLSRLDDKTLDELFPGLTSVVRSMSGNEGGAAQEMRGARALADLTVRIVDSAGDVIIDQTNVKMRSKPTARISAKGDVIKMPIKFALVVKGDRLIALDANLGADVSVDFAPTQLSIEDEIAAASASPPKKTSGRKKTQSPVDISTAH